VLYPAPEFRGLKNWINTPPIASMRQLLGKVVLIDFWTYSCINCLNAMPYVKTWHKKYNRHGLVVLGVHAPEFGFEKKYQNVLQAVKKHQIRFPLAQDNGFRLWRAYKNRYWPALYLIDRQGRVRYMHFREGLYQVT
jgi:thiol-disulfide isomerase/thioredoxin